MDQHPTLVVLSHLRWRFVFQRPQHIMTRMAARRPVLFIEEPAHDASAAPHWEFEEPFPGLTVCRPVTPMPAGGFCDEQQDVLRPLVKALVAGRAGPTY